MKQLSAKLLLPLLLCLLGSLALFAQEAPEEPDFFFLTGGPYTQREHSPQIIWANQWFFQRSAGSRVRDYTGAGRFEWGLTDNLEADFEFGALAEQVRVPGADTFSASSPADLLVGVRYRLLREDFAPFTLTLGPQVVAPAADPAFGPGKASFAWDTTAAKDWGGVVFLAGSVNLSVTPDVPAFPDGSGPRFDLSAVAWGAALGLRPLERSTAVGTHHDIHTFLEIGGTRANEIEAGQRVRSTQLLLSPGVRYGFVNRRGNLAEIGVAVPIGVNRNAPDWGLILQVQYEWASLF
jgi:hypothetical protein